MGITIVFTVKLNSKRDIFYKYIERRLRKSILRRKDSSVAVIIGALLTFVIISSLLGAYVIWYVPANGQQLDIQYISDTENSFLRLQNEISNSSPYLNEFVPQSFTLGIDGSPPFSSSSDSTIGYSSSMGFQTTLNYSMEVTVFYDGHIRTIPINVNSHGNGEIYLYPQTPFATPTNFYFQDDTILMQQPGSNYSSIVGSLPFSMGKNTTGGTYLNASQFIVTGQDTSEGGYGVTLLTLQYSDINQSIFYRGENVTVSNLTGGYTSAVVTNITLNSFYYNITSPQILAWNSALAANYNTSAVTDMGIKTQFTWQFTSFGFVSVTISSTQNSMSLYTTQTIYPYSANLGYFAMKLLQL